MKSQNIYQTAEMPAWKKQAASAIKQQDAEYAFMKAASNIVEEKAAPFFKDPYYLGFEIVKTNDTFTKMVGIFAFRINKVLFYIPVFYIDGNIKGTDLLYAADEKLFTVLNPDWCDYFISLYEQQAADAISSDAANKATQDLQLRWLAYPPYMQKGASATKPAAYKPESLGVIFDFVKRAGASLEEDFRAAKSGVLDSKLQDKPILRDFITRGGYQMFDKLASWIEGDFDFASNMAKFVKKDDFIVPSVLEQERRKTAAMRKQAKEVPVSAGAVLLHLGRFNPFTNKTASEQIEAGYSIEDNRPKEELEAVIALPEEHFTGFDVGYGIYDILTTGNDIVTVFEVSASSDGGKKPGLLISLEEDDPGVYWADDTNSADNIYGTTELRSSKSEPAGDHTPLAQSWSQILARKNYKLSDDESVLKKIIKDKPEAGKIYAIYDAKLSYISDEGWYIKEVTEEEDGGLQIIAYPCNGYEAFDLNRLNYFSEEFTLRVNPEADKILVDLKVFTPKTKWIEIPFEKWLKGKEMKSKGDASDNTSFKAKDNVLRIIQPDFIPGSLSTFYKQARELDYDIGAITYVPSVNKYRLNKLDGHKCLRNKLAAEMILMHDLRLSESRAEELLEAAKDEGEVKFMHKKTAGRILLNPDPEFLEGFDTDLNIKYQVPEIVPIFTQDLSITAPAPRYGDVIPSLTDTINATEGDSRDYKSPEEGITDILARTSTPNMLGDIAALTGQKALFEHGVVGALAKTTDATAYIGEYIPDLRQGLDKLGRLLFITYWSPSSMLSLYGSDDLSTMENNMLSAFKGYGDIVLELLKKTKDSQVNITSAE